jgi:hypothetical protein
VVQAQSMVEAQSMVQAQSMVEAQFVVTTVAMTAMLEVSMLRVRMA